jgi:methylmalonyl-CoA/ethylmalonyl-CoA epimerase
MSPKLSIDHIGYAVHSISESLNDFVLPLLAPESVSDIIEDPIQKVRIVFVTLIDGGRLELIEPLAEIGPLTKLLNDKRGGLYHVCYKTAKIDETVARFQEKGCFVVTAPVPARAFGGKRVAFVYTPARDLIEFVES